MGDIEEDIVDQPTAIFNSLDADGNGSLSTLEMCTRLSDFGELDASC